MRIYWLDVFESGNIGLMARPKGNEWLEDEIQKLKLNDVTTVISLLKNHEAKELEIEQEQHFCELNEIEFLNFPIEDRSIPTDTKAFVKLIFEINQRLNENKKIVVHCRMGIGRTSMVAAAVLICRGYSAENVFAFISKKRTLTVPDTEDQINWIKGIESELKSRI